MDDYVALPDVILCGNDPGLGISPDEAVYCSLLQLHLYVGNQGTKLLWQGFIRSCRTARARIDSLNGIGSAFYSREPASTVAVTV